MSEIRDWECKPYFGKLWYAEIVVLILMVIFGSIDVAMSYPILDNVGLFEISAVTASICRLIFMFWDMKKRYRESRALGEEISKGLNGAFMEIAKDVQHQQLNKQIDEYIHNNKETIIVNYNVISALHYRTIRVRANLLNPEGKYVAYDVLDSKIDGGIMPFSHNILTVFKDRKSEEELEIEGEPVIEVQDCIDEYIGHAKLALAKILYDKNVLIDNKVCMVTVEDKEFKFEADDETIKSIIDVEWENATENFVDYGILRRFLKNTAEKFNASREDGYKLELTYELSDANMENIE